MNYQTIGIDEWTIGKGEAVLSTTLGSCVSLCLWDPKTLTGGLNHFLLPLKSSKHLTKTATNPIIIPGKTYQHEVIEVLLEQMIARGIVPGSIHALVVGAAKSELDYYQVGEKNLEIALRLLKEWGVRNIQVSSGGNYSRRIIFYVHQGKVVIHKFDMTRQQRDEEEVIWL